MCDTPLVALEEQLFCVCVCVYITILYSLICSLAAAAWSGYMQSPRIHPDKCSYIRSCDNFLH
jgi:hypothetical protein